MIPGMGAAQDPVTGEVLPVDTTHTQLTPSTSSDTSKNVEDEEAKRRREAAEASSQLAQQARAVESLGVAPDVAAAAPPPAVSADPAAMPTGEGATGGIPTMATLPAQIDANASAQAAVQKQIADEKAALDARLATETKVRIETWNAEMEAAKRARADAKRPPEEKGFISDFFQAIAQGMGAYGATRGGGENHAAKILENQSKMEWEQHRARLDDAVKNLETLGKSREQIDGYADKERAKFVAAQQSRIDQMKAAADNMLKRFPDAQNKAFAAIAADQAKLDAEKQTIYKDIGVSVVKKGTSQEGDKLSSISGRDQNKKEVVTEADGKKADFGARVVEAVDTIKKSPQLSNDEFKKMNQNVQELRSQAEQAGRGLFGPAKIQAMQAFGIGAAQSFTDGIPEEKKPSALAWLTASGLIIRNESGAAIGSFENVDTAQKYIPQAGDGPKAYQYKLGLLDSNGKRLLMSSGASAQKRIGFADGAPIPQSTNFLEPPPASPSPAKPPAKPASPQRMDDFMKGLPAEERAAATRAFKVKPSDPGYSRAQNWLRSNGLDKGMR
jgi:hypothetical protein